MAIEQAEKYRAQRIAKGLSQFQLAMLSGLHPATISLVERGCRVTKATAQKLDAVLSGVGVPGANHEG